MNKEASKVTQSHSFERVQQDYTDDFKTLTTWFVNKNGRIHNRAMDLRIRRYCRLAGMDMEKSLHKVEAHIFPCSVMHV